MVNFRFLYSTVSTLKPVLSKHYFYIVLIFNNEWHIKQKKIPVYIFEVAIVCYSNSYWSQTNFGKCLPLMLDLYNFTRVLRTWCPYTCQLCTTATSSFLMSVRFCKLLFDPPAPSTFSPLQCHHAYFSPHNHDLIVCVLEPGKGTYITISHSEFS